MAHVLAVGDIVQVSMVSKLQDQYSFNVLNWLVTARTGATVTDDHVATHISTVYASLWKDLLATNATFAGVIAQVVSPDRYDRQVETGDAGAGTLTGDHLPTQVAGLVTFRTGAALRRARGRIYFPATSEAQNTSTGKLGAAYITAIETIMSTLILGETVAGGGNTADLSFGVWSRKFSQFRIMTEYFVRPDWATQRRRSSIRHGDSSPF